MSAPSPAHRTSRLPRAVGWLLAPLLLGCQCGHPGLQSAHSALEIRPASVDFGTVPLGERRSASLTLTNLSAVPVVVHELAVEGEAAEHFALQPAGGPHTLGPTEQLVVTVTYSPRFGGAHAARVLVESNASSTPELLVPLSARAGVDVVDAGPEIDAGAVVDAGPAVDAGPVVDAGSVDAGPATDAGPAVDAGPRVDAGVDAGLPEGPDAGPGCDVTGTCCPDGLLRCGTSCCPATGLAVGYSHACAMTSTSVRCWGDNSAGQLGTGAVYTRSTTPVEVVGLPAPIARLRAGDRVTCALTTGGAAYCWGDNTQGSLGNGTRVSSATPVAVSGLQSGVRDLMVGGGWACALTSTGEVKCWGRNDFWQLGLGNQTTQLAPTTVPGLATGVAALNAGAGDGHTCATLTSGAVRCWGYNGWGQLGDGTTTTPTQAPVTATNVPAGWTLTLGVSTAYALSPGGQLTAWGANDYGQLGDGQRVPVNGVTAPVFVAGGHAFTAVSGASRHHTCGLTTGGAVLCWGAGGLVGDGTLVDRLVPAALPGLSSGVAAIAVSNGGVVGASYSCALLGTGGVQCWGFNQNGQLGDGTRTRRLSPVFITDP